MHERVYLSTTELEHIKQKIADIENNHNLNRASKFINWSLGLFQRYKHLFFRDVTNHDVVYFLLTTDHFNSIYGANTIWDHDQRGVYFYTV